MAGCTVARSRGGFKPRAGSADTRGTMRPTRRNRGAVIVLAGFILLASMGLAVVAIDLGHLSVVAGEVQTLADAAADALRLLAGGDREDAERRRQREFSCTIEESAHCSLIGVQFIVTHFRDPTSFLPPCHAANATLPGEPTLSVSPVDTSAPVS